MATTDLARSLVDAAAEAIAEAESTDGFVEDTWESAGRAATLAVLEKLIENPPEDFQDLADAIREAR